MAKESLGASDVAVVIVVACDPFGVPTAGHVCKYDIDDNGAIRSKFGLSFKTGNWVPIKEGDAYPEECCADASSTSLCVQGIQSCK